MKDLLVDFEPSKKSTQAIFSKIAFCFAILTMVLLAGCSENNTGSRIIDFGDFKLTAPSGWTKFIDKGIDSYVGGLTNGKDTLWFDYGWYSAPIDDEDAATHFYAQDTINGLTATIQIPRVDGHGFIRLYIPHVNNADRFSFGGHDIQHSDTILSIFKSLVFKTSDTTKNGGLSISKFKEYDRGNGHALFNSNCASCHNPIKEQTGPAMNRILEERDNEWVYRFLTRRNTIKIDSAYRERMKQAGGITCIEFPDLTRAEVDRIIASLKGN